MAQIRFPSIVVLILAILLSACQPAITPTNVVERYLEAKQNNDFEAWKSELWAAQKDPQNFSPSFEKPGDLAVLSLSIGNLAVSDEETGRIKKMYSGSELAGKYGWSDEFIAQNVVAVSAQYTVDYDNTKVPYSEGTLTQYFYLVRETQDAPWLIWNMSY